MVYVIAILIVSGVTKVPNKFTFHSPLLLLMNLFRNLLSQSKTPIPLKTTQILQTKTFSTRQTLKMPLVVPGITSSGNGSKMEEWTNKLVGKKIGESSDATVCLWCLRPSPSLSSAYNVVDICTSRPPKGDACHRTRNDGYQGFQAREVECSP